MGDVWNGIVPKLKLILEHVDEGISFNEYSLIYSAVYRYCTSIGQNSRSSEVIITGEVIYKNLQKLFEDYLNNLYKEAPKESTEPTNFPTIRYYTRAWNRFAFSTPLLNGLFLYLNRHWIKRELDKNAYIPPTVMDLLYNLWYQKIFNPLQKQLIDEILLAVESERNGMKIDDLKLRPIIHSMITIALSVDPHKNVSGACWIYKEVFEGRFLEETNQFYSKESSLLIEQGDISRYIRKVNARILEEQVRLNNYFHSSTKDSLSNVLTNSMIRDNLSQIQQQFIPLVEAANKHELSLLYTLAARAVNGLDVLKAAFETFITNYGRNMFLIDNTEQTALTFDAKKFASLIIAAHSHFMNMVEECFKNDNGFVASIDKAFRSFVNHNQVCSSLSVAPELLAKFSDLVLRKGTTASSNVGSISALPGSDTETSIAQTILIFKYLEDKDVFQKYYTKALAKRLIQSMSISDDAESLMIAKLKEICGVDYTVKIQRMFTDIGTSYDVNNRYKQQLLKGKASNSNAHFEASYLVLGSSYWPISASSVPFTCSEALNESMQSFSSWYKKEYTGRALNMHWPSCKGELRASFGKTNYTFMVSAYQMTILLLFSESNELTFNEILQAVGMAPETLKAVLEILVKFKVLLGTAENHENNSYRINENFSNKKVKINLNIAIRSEAKAESEETKKLIDEDRRNVIQAAIVRIMKTRKNLKHVTLMNEVISQLQSKFKPNVSDIKKSIDILVDKDYLKREGQELIYVA